MPTDRGRMDIWQAQPQGAGPGQAERQPEESTGPAVCDDQTGYPTHHYLPNFSDTTASDQAPQPFAAQPLPPSQPPSHQQQHGEAPSLQRFGSTAPQHGFGLPRLPQPEPPLHPNRYSSYDAPPDNHRHLALIDPYWPSASNATSDHHQAPAPGGPHLGGGGLAPHFAQAYHPPRRGWDPLAGGGGEVYNPNGAPPWLGGSSLHSQAGPSLPLDHPALNFTSPPRSSDGRSLSFSGGSLDEGGVGFTMPTALSSASARNDQILRSTTSPSDISSPAQHASSTGVLYGKRPSTSESPSAVGAEDGDDPLHFEGMSRLDKRRNQNKLAQRAFRARTKVQNAETSTQMTQLMEVNEAQSKRLEDMAALISTLQKENLELKLAAINAGLPPNEHITSLGDERRPER